MSAVGLSDIDDEDLSNEDDKETPVGLAPGSANEELDEMQNDGGSQHKKPDDQIQSTGSQVLPSTILELETPVQIFQLYEHTTGQTNLYSVQQRQPTNIKASEIIQFISITIYMSIIQLPSTGLYWNFIIGHPVASSIKRFIHFYNNEEIIERVNLHVTAYSRLDYFSSKFEKYYLTIFFHFIDMAVVNSWLLATRTGKFDMTLLDIKVAIADALCRSGPSPKLNKVE
nr:unnamed protein product [Callosobruchus analis]